ncbi:stage V sporulation protein AC [Clostridium aceticum]|uniref:Stage V sporulation protein AC n=1 Tax=Clostridium aceticum TaxID=84022 RepID=A0A0D8ID40_9CLOT|nr:stage V sporulation protein AC [Clostridium aceticum]AKL94964.1 stage V sporulation protein AC [Clostridium aceticum]KJF27877.1 stage V sporulation protein AC [Clostridium aceticum]
MSNNLFHNKEDYEKYVQEKSPKHNYFKNCIWAFVVGGSICVIGQFVHNQIERILNLDHLSATNATILVMIFLGALFTGLGVYDQLGKRAGAGSIVPITGFANSIVAPAMEFKREGYVFGVAAKMFVLAGPVLVYGITTSVIVGILYYFIQK